MLPFNLPFRRLLRIFIPKLSNEDLDKHEQLVALRHQLIQERNILLMKSRHNNGNDNPNDVNQNGNDNNDGDEDLIRLNKQIRAATKASNRILKPFKDDYKKVQELYVERRRAQLTEKKYLQLPTSPLEVSQVVWPNIKMRWRGFKLFWFLFIPRRIKHSTTTQKITGAGVTVLLVATIYIFNSNVKTPSLPPTTAPVVATEVLSEETIPDATTGKVTKVIITKTSITTSMESPTVTITDTTKQTIPGKEPVVEK